MKKTTVSTVSIILSLVCLLCLVSCAEKVDATGLWENATYLSDTTLGKGEKTVSFTVEAEDQVITITLKTDKETLGEAMYEHGLVNDPSFFNVLNGIEANWEKDQAYWAFYNGDEYMMVGISEASVEGEVNYRFVYTK
ncbi:MAG: hypothetical protein IJY39_07415 [Clostridia bacterium]|nr:hypothetical protein [Clostridia bacterium]